MNVKEKNQRKFDAFLLNPTLQAYNFKPVRVCLYLTRACNLACPNCTYAGNEYFQKASFLNLDQFEGIINATRDFAVSYAFAGGEPLLNKNVLEFTKRVQGIEGATATINSNGLLMGKFLDRICESNVTRIQFSFDAMDDNGYQRERHGKPGDFNKLWDNVREVIKRRGSNPHPYVAISFLLHRTNFHELPDMIAFGESLGVDQVGFHNVNNHMDATLVPLRRSDTDVRALLDETITRKYDLDSIFLPPLVHDRFSLCLMPFKDIYINDQLEINPCCHVMDFTYSKFTGDLEESWHAPKLEKFRRAFIERRLPHGNCKGCQRRFLPYGIFSRESGWVRDDWKTRLARNIIKRSPRAYRFARKVRQTLYQVRT